MTAGIQVINESGTIQIDETYRNVFFESKTTVSNSGTGPTMYGTSNDGVIAATGCIVPYYYQSGSYYAGILSDHSSDIVYRFNRKATSATTYGLEVFDANGDLAFNSGWKPLRVVDVVSCSSSQQNNGLDINTSQDVVTKTYASDRTYAVITLSPMLAKRSQSTDTGQGGVIVVTTDWYSYNFTIASNVITFKWAKYGTQTGQAEASNVYDGLLNPYNAALFLVVDVTGY